MPDACSSLQANASFTRARTLVEHGYMVISFTDEDCNEARYNFTARRDALVTAGSQILKTDFPVTPTLFSSAYQVGNAGQRVQGLDFRICRV